MFLLDRGIFFLSGPDVNKFLQGVITNNVSKLSEGPLYAFLLNNQGKYLYDIFLIKYDSGVLLEYESSYRSDIVQHLKQSKINCDLSLKISSFRKVFSTFVPLDESCDYVQFLDPRSVNMGYRVFSKRDFEGLVDRSEYELKRIKNVIPDGRLDLIKGKSFPFECDFHSAIDLNKGCYVGQEVVARTVGRGVIRKKFFLVESPEGNSLPISKTSIFDRNNKKIGEMRSSVGSFGLALLRTEELEQVEMGDIFTGEVKIKVHRL